MWYSPAGFVFFFSPITFFYYVGLTNNFLLYFSDFLLTLLLAKPMKKWRPIGVCFLAETTTKKEEGDLKFSSAPSENFQWRLREKEPNKNRRAHSLNV